MIQIVKAVVADADLLASIGKQTFIESHGHSAKQEDLDIYITEKMSPGFFSKELSDPNNIYHIIYHHQQAAGYSKIILNNGHPDIPLHPITKLERIYVLKAFYPMKLGQLLFDFNLDLSRKNGQSGMWLYVWKENGRAFNFYTRNGFKIVGSYDFNISPSHSNPNHHLFLEY